KGGDGATGFRQSFTDPPELEPPAVSFVDWLSLPSQNGQRLLFCDMRSGLVGVATVTPSSIPVKSLTPLKNPSRAALCDLDGDGSNEIVIGELGSFTSEDHRRGAIVWLK